MDREEFEKKIEHLQMIAYDFDGVMTDNKVYVDENGKEHVCVNRGDGYAIEQIKNTNIRQVIFSTEKNSVVCKRAEKLGIEVKQSLENKKAALISYCAEKKIQLSNVMFIGNDLNDYEVMNAVGVKGCPADAEIEIQNICDWIASKKGGEGVVRELFRDLSSSKNWKFCIQNKQILKKDDMLKHIKKDEVMAIIPARSGSKGIPNKNIKDFLGFPLMAYTIGTALLSKEISRTLVTTDSEQYAAIARTYGAEVPFLRPTDISGDTATDMEFMRHAIEWLYDNEQSIPEYFVQLRITCPLRKPKIIDEAVIKLKKYPEASCLLSATKETKMLSPYKWLKRDGDFYQSICFYQNDAANMPRQSYPEVFVPNVYVDVLKSKTIIEQNQLHGNKMLAFETEETVDIDKWDDLEYLKKIFDKKNTVYRYLCNRKVDKSLENGEQNEKDKK